jgi:trans-aconitate methyltransferase
MNESDRTKYQHRYVERLQKYGHDPRTLGWASGKQAERFAVLTSFVPLDSIDSVLDVGCGFGDLCGFLRQRGFRGRYVGIDFIPELIEIGRSRFADADLRVSDLSTFSSVDGFGLVVASGIFNARLHHQDNLAHIKESLARMFSLCTRVMAVDFLTSYVDFRREDLYYMAPEEAFGCAKAMTRRVSLRHDYMPFEFALGLFRDDRLGADARFQAVPTSSALP